MVKHKKRIQAYIDERLYNWVQKKVKDGTFRSQSHAIEYALQRYLETLKDEDTVILQP